MTRWVRWVGVVFGGAAVVVLGGFLWFVEAVSAPVPPGEEATDGIAVLTGGGVRIETALRLLREGRARRLLISGVHPDAQLHEIARAAGVEAAGLEDRVTLGRTAASTRGNAQEVAAWARAEGLRSIRVVTAGYHMPRAMLELRRVLPGHVLVPHPVTPGMLRAADAVRNPRAWSLLIGEYLKYLAAWAGLSPVTKLRPEAQAR